jgi:diguanylate cyclase (GGDEF)-like protein
MKLADDDDVRRVIGDLHDQMRKAIDQLQPLVDARVAFEERRDQLTALGNDRALQEAITSLLTESKMFWVAFVEVDKFKRINDRFGYESADLLLQGVAAVLTELTECFPGTATAFRAHGDEFYLLGELPSVSSHVLDTIHETLDRARKAVRDLKVAIVSGEMNCTVSVGWACTPDFEVRDTARAALARLEQAVGEAKFLGRDRVVRYVAAAATDPLDSPRGDCAACRCKFSFDVRRASNNTQQAFFCPNCGVRIERPPEPRPPSTHDDAATQTGVVRLAGDTE